MNSLNERITKCRKLSNLTQTDMAEKLDIKCSTYSQMERKGIVSADRLFKMAEIFGVTPCHLYHGEEPCKRDLPLNTEAPENKPLFLKQPEPTTPKNDVFVVTKKEQKIIEMIRNFSKENRNRAMQFLADIYMEEKK